MQDSFTIQPQISVLSTEAIAWVHDHSLKILSEIGIRVDSDKALKVFKSAVDIKISDNHTVVIPPEIVEWAINEAPSKIDIYDRRGTFIFSLGEDQTKFGIGVTNLYYQNPADETIHPFNRDQFRASIGLGNCLPSYDIISTIGILQDVDTSQADLVATLEMVSGTTKSLILLISDERQFVPSISLLEQLVGDLSEKPFLLTYFNPVTPLILNRATAENMISSIERGLPIIFSNYGMAGLSTPISSAGTLTLLNAELLAGLVYSQLIKPGTPVVLGSLPAFFDMKSMQDFFDPQTMLLSLACAEMMEHYHIPHAGTSGSVNGWGPDLISGQTLCINHLTSCIGKVGLAPFVGGCFGSKVFSPTLVVYANEIIELARQFSKGFMLDEESLALDEMKKIGIGGNFVSAKQTMKLFRKAYHNSTIFPRISLEKWQEDGSPDSTKFLRQRTIDLINQNNFPDDQGELLNRGKYLLSQYRG